MAIVKRELSTDLLPAHLTDQQRYLRFCELLDHYSKTGEFDRADDIAFQASVRSVGIGTMVIGRARGTIGTVRRGRRQILAGDSNGFCLARNTENHAARVTHRGREYTFRPGAITLLRLDEPFTGVDGARVKSWTNVNLPATALRGVLGSVDDLVGREFAPGGALTLAMDYSDLLLSNPRAVDEAGMAIGAHLVDLITLGLGARADAAEAARRGGVRAVRLNAVLAVLRQRFAEPDFSAQKLAAAVGLSERYVNELLYEDGATFVTRMLELRLRMAVDLLVRSQRRRIADIAFECGFNDLSYFNRCFRRRFGLTPTAARGRG
jgi:AraC-like DNA-binding protein